jgi:hypothetical protein
MGFMTKKYGVSISFCRKLTFSVIPKGLGILSWNLNIFKTRKNLYTWPLYVTDLVFELYDQKYGTETEYEPHENEIRILTYFQREHSFVSKTEC